MSFSIIFLASVFSLLAGMSQRESFHGWIIADDADYVDTFKAIGAVPKERPKPKLSTLPVLARLS